MSDYANNNDEEEDIVLPPTPPSHNDNDSIDRDLDEMEVVVQSVQPFQFTAEQVNALQRLPVLRQYLGLEEMNVVEEEKEIDPRMENKLEYCCYPVELITKVNDGVDLKSYECPICLEIIINPLKENVNGHIFGSNCLTEYRKEKMDNKCPMCRVNVNYSNLVIDESIKSQLSLIEGSCIYKESGCTYESSLDIIGEHLKNCIFAKGFIFLSFPSHAYTLMHTHTNTHTHARDLSLINCQP